jgi:hypothetical protein
MKAKSFFIASLGCAKNSVDSESIASLLERDGFTLVGKPAQAEVLIVNTCGFIQQARQESLEVLRDLAEKKKPGQLLIAAGCFSELYREKLAEEVKGLMASLVPDGGWTCPTWCAPYAASQVSHIIIYLKALPLVWMIRAFSGSPFRAAAPTLKLRMAAVVLAHFVLFLSSKARRSAVRLRTF